MTVGEALSGRDNALNFVRLVLATLVIVSHASIGAVGEFPTVGDAGLGQLAVGAFFTLSGFLIARSRVTLTAGVFVWHRALRIFPAFWVCLVVVAFAFAPASTVITGLSWDPSSAASYVWKNAGLWVVQAGVENTLPADAFGYWNGSLWTLFYEFCAYLACGALLTLSFARTHRVAVMSTVMVAVTLGQWLALGPLVITGGFYVATLQLATFFAAGMWIWAVSDRLPVSHMLAAMAAIVFSGLVAVDQVALLGPLPVAYLCLWAGAVLPTRIGVRNDVSYGMYVYAFPVEQMLALAGFTTGGMWGFAALATLSTIPFAWASWLLVEKPTLRFRHAFGRGESTRERTHQPVSS